MVYDIHLYRKLLQLTIGQVECAWQATINLSGLFKV